MRKYTLRALRDMVRGGIAEDATQRVDDILESVETVGYSCGVYSINVGLLRGRETGTLYAITARNSNLFRYF